VYIFDLKIIKRALDCSSLHCLILRETRPYLLLGSSIHRGLINEGPPDVSKFSNVFERFFVVPEPAALFRNVDALENEETLGLGQSYCKETYTLTVTVPLLTNLSLRDRFGFLKNPRT
jgi:hypothetical protein